jgi:hypothetical protein
MISSAHGISLGPIIIQEPNGALFVLPRNCRLSVQVDSSEYNDVRPSDMGEAADVVRLLVQCSPGVVIGPDLLSKLTLDSSLDPEASREVSFAFGFVPKGYDVTTPHPVADDGDDHSGGEDDETRGPTVPA